MQRVKLNRYSDRTVPLLGKNGQLRKAFTEIAKAIQWWYYGPGMNPHCLTGPDQYTETKPFCNAGPDCVRCRQAVIARAACVHQQNFKLNWSGSMYIKFNYTGPRVRLLNSKIR